MELPSIKGMKLCSAGNTLSTKIAAMPITEMSYCHLILLGVRHTTLSNRCAIVFFFFFFFFDQILHGASVDPGNETLFSW